MNIEELTKSQIFLLTLLTSFVTSIATGIVTVALLDQAPPTITQSVNRIIRETAEKSAPSKAIQATVAAVAVPIKEAPPPPQHDVAAAIQEVTPSVVRIFTTEKEAPTFLGLGLVLNAAGRVVTDSDALGLHSTVVIVFSDGTSASASLGTRDAKTGLAYLKTASSSAAQASHFVPAELSSAPQELGQTVVSFFGKTIPRIASGLIVALASGGSDAAAPALIDTSIAAESIAWGTPLINDSGAVIGISTGLARSVSTSAFMPASAITLDDTASAPDALKKDKK